MCTRIQENLGVRIFQDVESSSHLPCSTWSLEAKNNILDPFHSPKQRAQRMNDWLQHIHNKAPLLSKKNPKALEYLSKICETSISPAQAWGLSFLVQDIGATDYASMSIAKLNRDTMHGPQRTFRNEWWSLFGRITTRYGEGFLTVHILRHTNVPEILWDQNRSEKDYSDVRIVSSILLPSQDNPKQENSTVYPESWELVTLLDQPFGIRYGKNHMVPDQIETIFPMQLQWEIAGHNITLRIDNTKPLFMMNSNGCLVCSDGIGIKKYSYPVLSGTGELDGINVQFQGVFEHAWESSVIPEGYASSIALRSFINIEKSFTSLTRPDDWLYFHINLSNNIQISCYSMPAPNMVQKPFIPTLFTIVNPNGTVTSPKLVDINITVHLFDDQGYPKNLTVQQKNKFTLHLSDLSITSVDSTEFSHVGAWVSGQWYQDSEQQPVTGFCFLQTTSRLSYEEKSEKILKTLFYDKPIEDFLQWSRETNYFKNLPENSDLTNSWLLWFIPVIIVSVLLILIVYLVWARQNLQKKPWIKAATMSRKHRFF
jgi:hypothetical protein